MKIKKIIKHGEGKNVNINTVADYCIYIDT